VKRRHWIWITVAIVLAIAAFAWAFAPQPLPVEAAEVRRAAFEQTIDEDGKTRVRERYVISAPTSGRLARIRLDPGDPVFAGKPVAQLTPTAPALLDARTVRELQERVGAAQAQLDQARAEVARAEAAAAQAQADLARLRRLEADGFVSAAAREQAELAARVQTRAVEAAKAAALAAEYNLAQARAALLRARELPDGALRAAALPVISPIDGRVLRVLQESEAVVAIGTPLVEVADPDDLEIVVDVLSTEAMRIAPGAPVHIEAGGLALQGRVRRVEPAAFTKVSALGVEEQRVNVIVDFASPPALWRQLGDGYRVDVRIVVLAKTDAVVAPVAALFRRDGGWAAFAVEDGRARLRALKLGGRSALEAWIEEGLAPGERVIVYPSDSVADGKRVTIVRGAR
jgi:HlyD family secretion protein